MRIEEGQIRNEDTSSEIPIDGVGAISFAIKKTVNINKSDYL